MEFHLATVSAALHFVDTFGSAILPFLFMKLVWFQQDKTKIAYKLKDHHKSYKNSYEDI